MKKRPPLDRSLSTRAQSAVLSTLDSLEALEELYELVQAVEILGKPEGRTGGSKDYVEVARPVEGEYLAKAELWDVQKDAARELARIRGELLGLKRKLAHIVKFSEEGVASP